MFIPTTRIPMTITFKQYLIQARKNPEQNPKVAPLEQLKKIYEDHPNAFVTFTQIPKFGTNPRSVWNTPLGIYAYPIKFVVDRSMRVQFAATEPYIFVFESVNGNTLNVSTDDANTAVDAINRGISSVIPREYQKLASHDSTIKETWQAMYLSIARFIRKDPELGWFGANKEKGPYGTLARKILRAAGYDSIVDEKHGIIHENEPTQAIFFDISKVKVIDMIRNKINAWIDPEYHAKITTKDKWTTRLHYAIRTRTRDRDVERLMGQFGMDYMKPNHLEEHPLALYAISNRQRIPAFEPAILFSPEMAITYAAKVIKGRWPELESVLLRSNNPELVMKYACFVIQGRWPKGEEIINLNQHAADLYDRFLQHGYPPGQLFYPQWS